MSAFYNEIDPKAAAWLRELIAGGHIAPGIVDERDIRDIRPDELLEYAQCHFFAGIGGWSLALRRAGWADDRPVWTGSCPCPPFSAAGKGQCCPDCGSKRNLCHPRKTGHFVCLDCGCDRHADARHLWPEFSRLIRECRPPVVFGEQVASADGRLWLDVVSADLRLASYGVGGADLCAAGLGAPHIRQRLWFVGVANAERHGQHGRGYGRPGWRDELSDGGPVGPLEHASGDGRLEGRAGADGWGAASGRSLGGVADRDDEGLEGRRQPGRERAAERLAGPGGVAGGLVDAERRVSGRRPGEASGTEAQGRGVEEPGHHGQVRDGQASRPGPVNGFWRDADWLYCRDEKWRPVEPGTFPLAHGIPGRVGLLRGYGNAIVPEAAQAFIEAVMA